MNIGLTSPRMYACLPSTYNTEELIRGWFSSNLTQVVYKLATPITIDLTPQQMTTLLGTNNIWADTGDTEVTYKADIQKYIQKLTGSTTVD